MNGHFKIYIHSNKGYFLRIKNTSEERQRMRGNENQQMSYFSYISPEERVPQDHPLRPIREMVDKTLKDLSPVFDKLYSHTGRPSIPPVWPSRPALPA